MTSPDPAAQVAAQCFQDCFTKHWQGEEPQAVCSDCVAQAIRTARQQQAQVLLNELDRRIAYNKTYRLDSPDKLRSGFSGIESGPCCGRCLMTQPKNPLQALVGCRNPFQLPEVCECHLPYRKVAVESQQVVLEELAAITRAAEEGT